MLRYASCVIPQARFIAQVKTGKSDLRRIEDIDGAALTYAEVKAIASGNPMVIEKAGIDAEVARLTRLRTQHIETQFRLRSQVRHFNEEVPRLEKRLEEVRRDLATRQDTHGRLYGEPGRVKVVRPASHRLHLDPSCLTGEHRHLGFIARDMLSRYQNERRWPVCIATHGAHQPKLTLQNNVIFSEKAL